MGSAKFHTVPFVRQNKSNTCWFAGMRMMLRWRKAQFPLDWWSILGKLDRIGFAGLASLLFDQDWDTIPNPKAPEKTAPDPAVPPSGGMSPGKALEIAEALGMKARTEQQDVMTIQSLLNLSPILWGGTVKGYRGYPRVAGQPGHVVVITGYENWQGELWLLVNDPYVDPSYPADEQRELWFTFDEFTSTLKGEKFAYWYKAI